MAGYDQYLRTNNSQQQGSGEPGTFTVSHRVFGAATSTSTATLKYLSAPATAAPAASAVDLGITTQACTIQNLKASMTTAPGGTDTCVFTVFTSTNDGTSYSATALTCTITGTATNAADTTHQVSVAAGVRLAVQINSSNTTGAGFVAGFEVA